VDIERRTSLRTLVGEVADDARDLVRGELSLARAEIDAKVDRVVTGAISVFGGMMLGYAGLVVMLLAGALALTRVLPDWAAFLIVGGVVLLIGGMLALVARRALAPSGMVPERTLRNVQADAMAAKDHLS